MTEDEAGSGNTFLRWYYLLTPVFWFLDVRFGWHGRLAFLGDAPALRTAYYLVCCALGVVALRAPRLVPRLALAESVTNIVFLILGVGAWYLGVLDWAGSESATIAQPTPLHLVNFVGAAIVAAVSYFRGGMIRS